MCFIDEEYPLKVGVVNIGFADALVVRREFLNVDNRDFGDSFVIVDYNVALYLLHQFVTALRCTHYKTTCFKLIAGLFEKVEAVNNKVIFEFNSYLLTECIEPHKTLQGQC